MFDRMKFASNLKLLNDEIDNIQIFADRMDHSSPSDRKALIAWLLELRVRCGELHHELVTPKVYPKFREHNQVRRKDRQGRPEMFVVGVHEGSGIIECGWYVKNKDGSQDLVTDKFGESALEFVVPEGQPQPRTTEELLEEAAEWNRKWQEQIKKEK